MKRRDMAFGYIPPLSVGWLVGGGYFGGLGL